MPASVGVVFRKAKENQPIRMMPSRGNECPPSERGSVRVAVIEEEPAFAESSEHVDSVNIIPNSDSPRSNSDLLGVAVVQPACRKYAAVSILFFVNLLNYMDRYTIAGVLNMIQEYFEASNAQLGILQTVFICSYMVFAPIFGYLGDRFPRKIIMSVGILIWSLSVFGSSFAQKHHFALFVLSRCVVGIGEASYSTVAPTIIADLFTHDMRSRMLMIFYFAIPVGSGLGFIVGSFVADQFDQQWQWGVRVTPVFGVVCLLLIIFVLQEPRRGESEASNRELERTSFKTDIVRLCTNRSYVWSSLGFTCVAFVAGALSWWAPTYVIASERMVHADKEPNEAHINLLFGIVTCLAGFIGVTVGSVWAQLWRHRNPRADPLVCGFGMLMCTPFLYAALVVVNRSLDATWPLMFVGITCLSLNWSIISDILLYVVIPSRRATASALQILFSHLLGDASSPYLVGQISDALRGSDESAAAKFYSLQYALFIPTFVCVVGGFFFLGTAWYLQRDKRIAEMVVKGELSETDVPGVAKTRTSARILTSRSSVGAATASLLLPSGDSAARLVVNVDESEELPLTDSGSSSSSEGAGERGSPPTADAGAAPAPPASSSGERKAAARAAHVRRRVASGRAPLASTETNATVDSQGLADGD